MKKEYKYGNIDGYSVKSFNDIDLDKLRTGLNSLNPAQALILVREIDRLNNELSK